MSNPYPSRRELRLQRERAERAKLRDAEIQRWSEEVEQRDTTPTEKPQPVPAAVEDAEDTGDENVTPVPPLDPIPQPEDDTPVEEVAETPAERRRRRADSAVTSTGMLPIISKPIDETKRDKPRSRREARKFDAQRAAERRAEVERLHREQGEAEAKARRRATAPQTTPAPAPAITPPEADPTPAEQPTAAAEEEVLDVEITGIHDLSATEITDLSGLDTIEIRRAELRAETERLTQEIIELGESNPNVIDPKLLRRQKELAEKSQELQDLETAAIELVESENQDAGDETSDATVDDVADQPQTEPDTAEVATAAVPAQEEKASAPEQSEKTSPGRGRRRRRSTQGPFVTGPFEVDEEKAADAESSEQPPRDTKKPPLAEFIRAPVEPEPERDPREPLEASSAHGLDTLDAKDVEAPERRLRMSAIIMFAIGLIALIIAIILLAR